MDKTDFLVIESDAIRAGSVMSALQFLGFHPQRGTQDVTSLTDATQRWRGVYVGDIADADARPSRSWSGWARCRPCCRCCWPRIRRGPRACSAPARRLPRGSGVIGFPLRYEQFAEAMRGAMRALDRRPPRRAALRRRFARDGPGQCADPPGGAVRFQRAGAGRVGHRQGNGGAHHPRLLAAPRQAVRRDQLRRDSRRAAGERAVRSREGRLHRRDQRAQGPLRDGRGRHAVPRRDRRHEPADAGEAAARAAGAHASSASAATRPSAATCASSPPPIATSSSRSPTASSAKTCSIASACSRWSCRRCASAWKTCRC